MKISRGFASSVGYTIACRALRCTPDLDTLLAELGLVAGAEVDLEVEQSTDSEPFSGAGLLTESSCESSADNMGGASASVPGLDNPLWTVLIPGAMK